MNDLWRRVDETVGPDVRGSVRDAMTAADAPASLGIGAEEEVPLAARDFGGLLRLQRGQNQENGHVHKGNNPKTRLLRRQRSAATAA